MQQLVIQGDSSITSGTIEDNSELVLVSMMDGMMGQVPQRFSFWVELFFRNLSSVTFLDVVVNGCLVRCEELRLAQESPLQQIQPLFSCNAIIREKGRYMSPWKGHLIMTCNFLNRILHDPKRPMILNGHGHLGTGYGIREIILPKLLHLS